MAPQVGFEPTRAGLEDLLAIRGLGHLFVYSGTPGEVRTPDPNVRSVVLSSTELQAH